MKPLLLQYLHPIKLPSIPLPVGDPLGDAVDDELTVRVDLKFLHSFTSRLTDCHGGGLYLRHVVGLLVPVHLPGDVQQVTVRPPDSDTSLGRSSAIVRTGSVCVDLRYKSHKP